jgi:23S rRNA (uridine2552-2'-O)-methyltransferase
MTTRGHSGRGRNKLSVRVKTARGRTVSSQRWLERQLNDPYVHEAQKLGYRSRAAFKLVELDDRFKFLKPGRSVIDLGAAPGGWSQVAADRVGAGQVIAIDIQEMDNLPGVTCVQMDFSADEAPAKIMELAGGKVDVVISDMAAPLTGHKSTDHLRTLALAEMSAYFAFEALTQGGFFCAKVFQGGTTGDLLQELKTRFETVSHVKPKASRKESVELYVIAQAFKG